jgi:hypothetical protein
MRAIWCGVVEVGCVVIRRMEVTAVGENELPHGKPQGIFKLREKKGDKSPLYFQGLARRPKLSGL